MATSLESDTSGGKPAAARSALCASNIGRSSAVTPTDVGIGVAVGGTGVGVGVGDGEGVGVLLAVVVGEPGVEIAREAVGEMGTEVADGERLPATAVAAASVGTACGEVEDVSTGMSAACCATAGSDFTSAAAPSDSSLGAALMPATSATSATASVEARMK